MMGMLTGSSNPYYSPNALAEGLLLAANGLGRGLEGYGQGLAQQQALAQRQKEIEAAAAYRQAQLDETKRANQLTALGLVQPKTEYKDGQWYNVYPGGSIEPIGERYTEPKTDGTSPDFKTLRALFGRDPTYDELTKFRQTSQPSTTINMGPQTKKFEEISGELGAKRFMELSDQVANGEQSIESIRAMRTMLDAGLQTGALEPAKNRVAAIAQGFGINPDSLGLPNATDAQMFNSLVMKNLLAELVKQKGPQTEGDAQRAMKTYAQLENTPEANRWILNYAEALNLRQQEKYAFMEQALNANGGNWGKAEQEWMKSVKNKRLVGTSPQTGMPVTYYQALDMARKNNVSPDQFAVMWLKMSGGE